MMIKLKIMEVIIMTSFFVCVLTFLFNVLILGLKIVDVERIYGC